MATRRTEDPSTWTPSRGGAGAQSRHAGRGTRRRSSHWRAAHIGTTLTLTSPRSERAFRPIHPEHPGPAASRRWSSASPRRQRRLLPRPAAPPSAIASIAPSAWLNPGAPRRHRHQSAIGLATDVESSVDRKASTRRGDGATGLPEQAPAIRAASRSTSAPIPTACARLRCASERSRRAASAHQHNAVKSKSVEQTRSPRCKGAYACRCESDATRPFGERPRAAAHRPPRAFSAARRADSIRLPRYSSAFVSFASGSFS